MSNQFWLRFGTGDPRTYAGLSPTFLLFSQPDGTLVTPPSITDYGSSLGMYSFTYSVTTPLVFLVDGSASITATDRYIAGALDPVQRADDYISYLSTSVGALSSSVLAFSATLSVIGSTLAEFSEVSTSLAALSSTLIAQGSTLVGVGNTVAAINADVLALGSTTVAIGNTVIALGSTTVGIGASLVPIGQTLGALATLVGDTSSSFGSTQTDPSTILGYLRRNQEFQEGNAVFTKSSGTWSIYSRGSSTLLRSKTLTNDATEATKS